MPSLTSAPAARRRMRFCWASPRLLAPEQAQCRIALLALLLAATIATSDCGKKGPPLAPLSNRPRAPEAVSARRVGDQVIVRFTIPRANQSGVQPANIERVEVYAMTGPRLQLPRFLEEATLVGTIQVRRPPPEDGQENGASVETPRDDGSLEQGAQGVVVETLAPAAFEPATVRESQKAPSKARKRSAPSGTVLRRTVLEPPDVGPAVPPPPTRYYSVVGVNFSGRRGTPSPLVAVTLGPAPPAPLQPDVLVRSDGVEISWSPPAGLRGPIREADPDESDTERGRAAQGEDPAEGEEGAEDESAADSTVEDETAADGETVTNESTEGDVVASETQGSGPLRARPLLPWASPTFGYNVYRIPSVDPSQGAASPHLPSALPHLLTPRPLTAARFVDKTVRFGQARCYVVRVVETTRQAAESESSPPRCVDVADVFPPSPPKSLAAVAGEGSISLIWEANTEPDLAGYIVLRAEAGSEKFQPVTRQTIRETTWRDTGARRGVRYAYAVIAVDNATPPNRSEPSNQVEETAR